MQSRFWQSKEIFAPSIEALEEISVDCRVETHKEGHKRFISVIQKKHSWALLQVAYQVARVHDLESKIYIFVILPLFLVGFSIKPLRARGSIIYAPIFLYHPVIVPIPFGIMLRRPQDGIRGSDLLLLPTDHILDLIRAFFAVSTLLFWPSPRQACSALT
jgi:hypothetical protein